MTLGLGRLRPLFRVLRYYRKEPNPPPDIRGGIQSMITKEMNYFHYSVYQYQVNSVMGPWTLKTRSIPNDLSSLQCASLRHRYHLILGALVLAIGTRFLRGQLKRGGIGSGPWSQRTRSIMEEKAWRDILHHGS